MAEKLSIVYDNVGDILYINTCSPYLGQNSEEIKENVIARLNPETEAIENLEILFFSQWIQNPQPLDLPLVADLHLSFQL